MVKNKKRGQKYFLIFFAIMLLGMVSAGFSVGNHSIQKTYAPKGTISGWVNMSFTNELSTSIFTGSNGGQITLKELLDKNSNFVYSCTPENCEEDYSANDGAETITFDLDAGEKKLVGFKLTKNIEEITSMNFKVESDAEASCENQLKIDFFDDKTVYVGNNKSSEESCTASKNYSCFNPEATQSLYQISTTPYCQKITLSESSGFFLGAWIKKEGDEGNKQIKMILYDKYGSKITDCILSGVTTAGGEVQCGINLLVQERGEYHACILSDAGTGTYYITGSSTTNGCGFYGTPPQSYTPGAYRIFAIGKRFNAFGEMNITNSLYGKNFADLVESYIREKYGTLDCRSGCVVPMNFASGKNQTIILKNLQIEYKELSAGITSENKFYELRKVGSKINANPQKLFLDNGGFIAHEQYGNKTFTLKLNNTDVFSEMISVSNLIPEIKGVSPTTTAAAFPTKFKVSVNSSSNITKYEWDFGEQNLTTTKNEVTYTYDSIGVRQMKVKVTDLRQQSSSKVFEINVTSPKDAINITLNKNFGHLSKIKTQINTFSGFYKETLSSVLNTTTIEAELNKIKTDYASASTDAQYITLMETLADYRIPSSIEVSEEAKDILFYPDASEINLETLKSIGGGTYNSGDTKKYSDAVLAWNQENLDTKISFRKITANYEEGAESLVNFFEISVDEKEDINYDYYLIINGLENINFEENYGQKKLGNAYHLMPPGKVVFSTTEEVDFTNIPAFISPGISKLSIDTSTGKISAGKGESKWDLFVFIIIGLLLVGITVYIILQQWYKHKYENYLFTDRNHLYNLLTYVDQSKKKGAGEKEIEGWLKKAGWNSEQTDYVLKKHAGRRTGMLELPITKILEKLKNTDGENAPLGRVPNTGKESK